MNRYMFSVVVNISGYVYANTDTDACKQFANTLDKTKRLLIDASGYNKKDIVCVLIEQDPKEYKCTVDSRVKGLIYAYDTNDAFYRFYRKLDNTEYGDFDASGFSYKDIVLEEKWEEEEEECIFW